MRRESDPPEKIMFRCKTYIHSLLTKIVSRFSRDPLLKGILILGSGTAVSQILGIIFVPVITRIYSPAIYGTAAVFTSLLQILLVGVTLRYDSAILIAESEDDAEYLLILSLLILSALTIIFFVVLVLWGDYLAGIFQFEFLAPHYWLLSVGLLGGSLYLILKTWALLPKDYILITRTGITQSITGSVSKIILGVLSLGSFGLIIGDIIGRTAGFGSLGKKILPKIWHSLPDLDMGKLKSLAFRYWKFPVFSLPSAFINSIALQVPTLILAYMFDYHIVGLYALSFSITYLPVSFVSVSIGQAYTAECSGLFRQKSSRILPLYLDTTRKLFIFGAPMILAGAFISPFVFPIIFGSAWKDAGMFVLPLSIFVIAQFVVTSTDRLELYGYNHWALIWNVSRTVLVLCGFYAAILLKLSPLATIVIFSSILTVMYAICYLLNIKAIQLCMKK
jgi:O-antigen/teichoic acid export membrane protein